MKLILNILWIIFGGLISCVSWAFLGLILYITIIGIPFGRQCFKCAELSLAPFGKKINLKFTKHPIANTIWLILVGWLIFLSYILGAIVLCITIIGIPWGVQIAKFAKLGLAPFGAIIK